jgi:DNA replication initiation complex subunit (GINS family)
MTNETLSYKILRKIQQEEKSSPMLSKINDNFYMEASVYNSDLQKRLKNEQKTTRNIIISEQVQNTEKIIRNIYELREKKIILAAMSKARGGTPLEKHLLPNEKHLFSSIYSLLIQTRNTIFEHEKGNISEQNLTTRQENIDEDIKENNDGKLKKNQIVIRILDSIPTFIGTDTKSYDLRKGDIVSVPEDLGFMLIQKHVAETISV